MLPGAKGCQRPKARPEIGQFRRRVSGVLLGPAARSWKFRPTGISDVDHGGQPRAGGNLKQVRSTDWMSTEASLLQHADGQVVSPDKLDRFKLSSSKRSRWPMAAENACMMQPRLLLQLSLPSHESHDAVRPIRIKPRVSMTSCHPIDKYHAVPPHRPRQAVQEWNAPNAPHSGPGRGELRLYEQADSALAARRVRCVK